MRHPKFLLIAMLFLPWITVPLLGKKEIKKFLPASLFISCVVILESYIARKHSWWWFYQKLHPKLIGEFLLIWGPFLIGSMWILKLTYGKFFTYMISNLIIDTIFTYPFVYFLQKSGISSLVRLKKYQLSLLFFLKSMLLYGFQFTIEKTKLVKG
ncbi:hypothetical protein ACFFIX_03495 [Metabacillus herbersteinensis]|uniref:Lycopene cyclase domain-containing protein n=1 Tax=Metabacillus herbersteinensis TaxID=283816 RepID=A0ABV6GA17_9BACI